MANWYGAYNLFRRETTRFRKIIIDTTVSPIISNVLYLIIFNVAVSGRQVQGVDYIKFLAPGLITLTLINSAFSNPSFALVIAKFSGSISDILIAPLTGTQIVLAYVGAAMVRALVTAFATLLVILLFTHLNVEHIGLAILGAFLTSFFFGTLGAIFGYFAKQFDSMTMMTTFIMTPMSFLGGVFYPVSALKGIWQTVSRFNPMLYFIDLMRYSFIDKEFIPHNISLTVAILANVIIFPLAIYLFTKGKRLTVL
ncbi:MAG: ABC transporter permease [Candidatus Sericytochromatia bacterium]|nr:ABC transporter permease [Candidatus Sericytochromatia bacterium]